jgi:hypothetical protein
MSATPPGRRPAVTAVRGAVALLALAAGVLGSVAGGEPAGASRAPSPVRPAGGAAMVGWHEKGDDLDALRAHEAQLGTRFAVVRVYQQWKPPSGKIDTLVAEDRLVLASHKPPTAGWAAVASGAEDATITLLADRYRAYGREVMFSFHHEPHDDAADVKGGTAGTAADYLAAWRRIHRIFVARGAHHSAGGNVYFAYSATGSWALAAAPGGPAGSGDPLYPGHDVVDVLAHDRYNWASCRGDGWEEFEENWAPLVALAAGLGKPLIAGEVGAAPAGGLRNDWFRRGAEWMRTDPLARRWMWGFAYYHSLHDTCPWDFLNQGDDGAPGWREAFSDPYFTGTPFSLASADGTGAVPRRPPVESTPAPPDPPPPFTPSPGGTSTPAPSPALAAATAVSEAASASPTGELSPGTGGEPQSAAAPAGPFPTADPADRPASASSREAGDHRPLPPLALWLGALLLALGVGVRRLAVGA